MKFDYHLQVENLAHLGLVAGIIDDIGIVEQINQLVGQGDDSQWARIRVSTVVGERTT
jgi:hypothetical protein